MGEPFSHAEVHPSHRSFQQPGLNGEDEPYTIKCICGFDDDHFDGFTVYCEQCNTWQHIACYYSPNTKLAPDAEHSCIDCKPHQRVDADAAAHHQKTLRLPHSLGDDRKGKRANTKNHRKSKTRDLNNNAVHINGYALQEGQFGSPSTGGSPRDSMPPAKKPKTSHRPSASIANGQNRPTTNGRHRSASSALALANPPKPPLDQCPQSYLSSEFIRVHRENTDFNRATANLHLNISVTSLLSTWLDDKDAFEEATNGYKQGDVFQQFPQAIEELETSIQKHVHTEPHVRFHGAIPQWPYLTVGQDLLDGNFVGELRGCIGRREDYQSDPVNQWNKLRHPDHFVFFHPHLPIYIDARQEGTILRYARRSCRPNLKMTTLITGAREYRFCFIASQDIPQGTEITIAWDTQYDTQLQNALSKTVPAMSMEDFLYCSEFFGNNLAHFGGCACENHQPSQGPCLAATFDRRACKDLPNGISSDNKSKRKRSSKKSLALTSTHGSNSRESSEEVLLGNHDGDMDMADGRSTTQSTKSSRDGTPSNNNSNSTELSERDKKKLAQQERLFEQMEHERQVPGVKKKKRNSGSNANTPTAVSHRLSGQPPFSNSNPATPISGAKAACVPQTRSPINRSPFHTNAGRTTQQRSAPQPVRPVYVDASTQTMPDVEQAKPVAEMAKKVLPRSKQLLRRSLFQSRLRNEVQLEEQPTGSPQHARAASPTNSQAMDTDSSSAHSPITPTESHEQQAAKTPDSPTPPLQPPAMNGEQAEPTEVSMPDTEHGLQTATNEETVQSPTAELASAPVANTNPVEPVKPPPPPWPAGALKTEESIDPNALAAPVAPMQIDLPPNNFVKPTAPSVSSPLKTPEPPADSAHSAAQNAIAPPPLDIPNASARTPEANSLTKPSPVKKKMSLSDYMSKRNRPSMSMDKMPTPGSQGSSLGLTNISDATKAQSPDPVDDSKG